MNKRVILWVATCVVFATLILAVLWLRKPSEATEADAPAPPSTGRVAFLMEQQWLVKLKLAKAEDATLAPQIHSTGRVVPVPAKHAVVAPPVGGFIRGTMPRIGERVAKGQHL